MTLLPQLLSETDENSFRATYVAKPVHVLVVDDLIYDRCSKVPEFPQRFIKIRYREHDAQIAERIDRCKPVIRGNGRSVEVGQLNATMTVRSAQHCNLDSLVSNSCNTSCPLTLDHRPTFKSEAEFNEE